MKLNPSFCGVFLFNDYLLLLEHIQSQLPSHIKVKYLEESKYFEFLINLGDRQMWSKFTVEFVKENKHNINELFSKIIC